MNTYETIPVSDFQLPSDKVEAALAYPGPRPEGSFYTDGSEVTLLPNDFARFKYAADARLSALNMPLIEDRIPVLAYGANANPDKLIVKMGKFDTGDSQLMQNVPHCAVHIPNTAAVWHGRPGQNGSYFAELYSGPETTDTTLQAHVAFLTIDQLGALDATEGATYTRIEMDAVIGTGVEDVSQKIIAYAALESQILLDEQARPVLVAGIKHDSEALSTMTAGQVVTRTLAEVSSEITGAHDEFEFVTIGLGMKLSEKKLRQADVQKVMVEKQMSRRFSVLDDNPEQAIGRVDFASLPGNDKHVHYVPEMIWPRDMARANSRRAFSELSVRTGLAIVEPKA